jgi:hypothetical protein
MASTVDVQQELLRLVQTATGDTPLSAPSLTSGPTARETPAADAFTELTRELDALRKQLGAADETARRQAEVLEVNTRAVLESNRRGSAVGSLARDAVSTVTSGGGLGLLASPLGGLVGWLLGRRSPEPEADLPAFTLPNPIAANLGFAASNGPGLDPVTYRADGTPRSAPAQAPAPGANITIHVQAMDSRSFMDNSDQIARAVREAMLNSHPLNDVIGEM